MKLGFILQAPFHILSVFQETVDESIAGVCYLAMQLAKLGHDITIFSQISKNIDEFGVRCRKMHIENDALELDSSFLENDYDAFIFVNDAAIFAATIKQQVAPNSKVYLWTALDVQHPLNNSLNQEAVVAQIDGVICVSQWQKKSFVDKTLLQRDNVTVMPYAIAPYFEDLFLDKEELIKFKTITPSLAYIGNPEDGLEILLDKFDDVRNSYKEVILNIYADFSAASTNREIQRIYELAMHTKNVLVNNLPAQIKLAHLLCTSTVLAYPAIIPANSYVMVLQAMAAGLYPVTSTAGAITEYCFGRGKNVESIKLRKDSLDSFVGQILSVCQTQTHQADAFFDYCYKQVQEVNSKHTWRVRAREWVKYLAPAEEETKPKD